MTRQFKKRDPFWEDVVYDRKPGMENVVIDESWVPAEYAAAREPMASAAEVRALRATPEAIHRLFEEARRPGGPGAG